MLGGASDDAAGSLTDQPPVVASVVDTQEPILGDASEPAEKVLPVDTKPEKVRMSKTKDASK